MPSDLEFKARKLDDESKSVYQLARKLSPELGVTIGAIANWLYAKRSGHASFQDHKKERILKNHSSYSAYLDYIAKRNGCANWQKYKNKTAQKYGFTDTNEYILFLYHKEKNRIQTPREYIEWKIATDGLNDRIKFWDHKKLKHFYVFSKIDLDPKIDVSKLVKDLISSLKPRYQKVIEYRFFGNYTLEETGKKLNITRQRAKQIEKLALNKLYFQAKQTGLYKFYIEQ